MVSDTFTGAEIEAVIEEALFNAFDKNRDITLEDLVDAATDTSPLAETAPEKIKIVREWVQSRARLASTSRSAAAKTEGRKVQSNA